MKTAKLQRYFVVGDKLLCFIPRTGSTSLLRLIEDKHYPDSHKAEGVTPHFRLPSIIDDHKSEMCAMIRNPIDRFISGCTQKKWTVAEGIEELKNERVDIHIRPQYTYLSELRETKLFKFPEQINDCAEWLGLPTPVPMLNVSKKKPEVTKEQIEWLTEYYKKDFELFNKLKII
jgi:hypothetical protein